MRYLAQFPAGTLPLVEAALRAAFHRVRLLRSDDSAVVFATDSRISARDAPFAKNLFLLHADVPRGPLDASIVRLSRGLRLTRSGRDRTGFRIMCHIDGRLVAIEPRIRTTIERAVASTTGTNVRARGQCQEYWVIGRRDWPLIYLGERLPGATNTVHRRPGSLSEQVASLLVAASKPTAADVFLDPFGGSGAIVRARVRLPARKAIYSDTHLKIHRADVEDLARDGGVDLRNDDALSLPSIAAGSVDAIVTDPPWGEFTGELADYGRFASDAAFSLARVLRPTGGRVVVLMGRRKADTMSDALSEAGLQMNAPLDILVNGHPATVLRAASPGRLA